MKKTLYLHIGTPKTATTAIQMFCEANQNVLNEKGYDYPILPFKYPHVRIQRNGHFLVAKLFNEDKSVNEEKTQEIREQGFQMLDDSFKKYDNVILSDENIWHSTAFLVFDAWKRLKEYIDAHNYDLKVIVYIRRQDALLTSWLNQQIQDGWNSYSALTWEDYIQNPTGVVINYYEHLENIAGVVGKNNIVVRIFERDKFEGNGNTIQSDFLKVIGLDMTDDFYVSDQRDNVTLSLNACEVKRIINTLPDCDGSTHFFAKQITEKAAIGASSEYKSDWFSIEERKQFLEQCQESNEKIAREYLGKEDGILFNQDIKQVEKWDPHNPYMYEEVVRFFGEMTLVQQKSIKELKQKLTDQNKKNQTQIKQLKDQIKEEKAERKKKDAELKAMIRELEQTSLWFRLRRKWKHITGKDK